MLIARLTLFADFEALYSGVEADAIIVLSRSSFSIIGLRKRMRASRRFAQVDVWNLLLSLSFCTLRAVGTRTGSLLDSNLTLLTDAERLCFLAKALLVIVLTWSYIYITTFGERLGTSRGRAKIDIWHLVFRLSISSLRRIGTRAHALFHSLFTLFTNSEAFDTRIEPNTVIIFTRSSLSIIGFGKTLRSCW